MVDFSYYRNSYFGTEIEDEKQFIKLEKKAVSYLKMICAYWPSHADTQAQDAICAVADIFYTYDDMDGIKSQTIDGLTLQYTDRFLEEKLYKTAKLYLGGDCLYRGI